MEIKHSANFISFEKFMAFVEKLRTDRVPFDFSGSVNANADDNDNFSVNWTSDEEV